MRDEARIADVLAKTRAGAAAARLRSRGRRRGLQGDWSKLPIAHEFVAFEPQARAEAFLQNSLAGRDDFPYGDPFLNREGSILSEIFPEEVGDDREVPGTRAGF